MIVKDEKPKTAFAWSLMIRVTGAVIIPNTCKEMRNKSTEESFTNVYLCLLLIIYSLFKAHLYNTFWKMLRVGQKGCGGYWS